MAWPWQRASASLGGRDAADGVRQAPVVEPVTRSSVATSTALQVRRGPHGWITPVLNSPLGRGLGEVGTADPVHMDREATSGRIRIEGVGGARIGYTGSE